MDKRVIGGENAKDRLREEEARRTAPLSLCGFRIEQNAFEKWCVFETLFSRNASLSLASAHTAYFGGISRLLFADLATARGDRRGRRRGRARASRRRVLEKKKKNLGRVRVVCIPRYIRLCHRRVKVVGRSISEKNPVRRVSSFFQESEWRVGRRPRDRCRTSVRSCVFRKARVGSRLSSERESAACLTTPRSCV